MHVAFSVVEHETFRDLIIYICPALEPFLVRSGNAIQQWILKEFERQNLIIRNEFAAALAKSQIYINFDLWTSPNSLAFCAVVARFLSKDRQHPSLLISLPRVRGCYSGENMLRS
jgi:hypothetical protein